MNDILTVLQTLLVAVVPVLTPFIIKWIKAYSEHVTLHLEGDKTKIYMDELIRAVTDAVAHTSQTYVNEVKNGGTFNAEAQRNALLKAKQVALNSLTVSAKKFLEQSYTDLGNLIEIKIEAAVNTGKTPAAAGTIIKL